MTRKPVELFDCARVASYIDSYLLGQVPPPERRGMRQHIHGCSSCFEKVAARDPLQLFAPLADQTQPDPFWEGFWPAIEAGIEREESRQRSRRLWLRAAAAVVLIAAAVAALRLLPGRADRPAEIASGRTAPAPTAVPIADASTGSPMPETVEQVRTEGRREVQVYTMSYTQGPMQSTRGAAPVAELVLIVDKGLEL